MTKTSRLRCSAAVLISLVALGCHLFALTLVVVESRTVLRPTTDVDGSLSGEELLIDGGDDYEDTSGTEAKESRRGVGLRLWPSQQQAGAVQEPAARQNGDKPLRIVSMGLRRIQRQPDDVFGLQTASRKRAPQWQIGGLEGSRSLHSQQNATTTLQVVNWPNYWNLDDDNHEPPVPQKRSAAGQLKRDELKKSANKQKDMNSDAGHKFIYVISPISELVHPFQAERFAQGYKSLLPLSENYKIGLQKMSGSMPMVSGDSAGFGSPLNPLAAAGLASHTTLGCRATRTLIRLDRNEVDPLSGQLVRYCTGSVELNTCEGSCASGIQPSIKSPTGFAKRCSCCNEGAFRRVQVRLSECSRVPSDNDLQQQQQQQQQQELVAGLGSNAQQNFMDIEVEEPIECECRKCDSLI